jgi:hypothetical protein
MAYGLIKKIKELYIRVKKSYLSRNGAANAA